MTEIVVVPAAPAVPPFPALGDPAFNSKAYDWGSALPGVSNTVQAIAVAANTNATAAKEQATAASISKSAAAADAVATAADRIQTGLDRVQTGLDRSAAAASAVQASKLNLGNKSTPPTLDNQGDALLAGSTYYDTTLGKWRVWTGAAWGDGISTVAGVSSLDGQAGPLTLKTINGLALLGAGNIEVGASLYRVARTSNTMLTAADKGKLIDITSGTFTQSFAAAATLGDGWFCYIRNSGTGDITLDPDGLETIDGLTSYVMYPGECRLVLCDGVALRSIVITGYSKTFAASATYIKPPGYAYHGGLIWNGGCSGRMGGSSPGYGGASGGCFPFHVSSAFMGATEPVTIGAGGLPVNTADTTGLVGGASSFGSLIVMPVTSSPIAGSSYPGAVSATASGFESAGSGGNSIYGGLNSSEMNSGKSLYGGGNGGSVNPSGVLFTPGTSKFGGNGGAAGKAVSGSDGAPPGGGGGGTLTGTRSGAGARGELQIWGII